jgi:hypothetical protein
MWTVVVVATAAVMATWNVPGIVGSEQSLNFDTEVNCNAWLKKNEDKVKLMGYTFKGTPCVFVEVDADGNVVE